VAQALRGEMPLQIATASFTLLFAALLMLSSRRRFLDGRASSLNPAVATRAAVTQIANSLRLSAPLIRLAGRASACLLRLIAAY
jgi:hypothetical protein